MPSDCITYQNSGYFSALITDYLNESPNLKPLYHRFPSLENFDAQRAEKQQNYSVAQRQALCAALHKQYRHTEISKETRINLEFLQSESTFTVTTGHQLNLFTGPLYFLYKIISAINLSRTLKQEYPHQNFVPVYWMATEDHDFEEINHFQFEEKKIQWNREASGPVGRLDGADLEKVLEVFSQHLGAGTHAQTLRNWFDQAYLQHDNLADATRYLANALFGSYGLVIVDGDDRILKTSFKSHLKSELLEQRSESLTVESFELLQDYNIQVNPRQINLFYILDGLRERIVLDGELYKINQTDMSFSREALLEELDRFPERFSPNVILRPLYQEVVLPNLCYIGGGGELAYWLELKKVFEHHQICFPILLLRNSALLVSHKQLQKIDRLDLSWRELFLKTEELLEEKTRSWSKHCFDFDRQKQFLNEQFDDLLLLAQQTDPSFIGAVKAQAQKQINGLNHLEKRLLKAEKRVHKEALERLVALQLELFPGGSLQERTTNFSQFYKAYGPALLDQLIQELDPLDQQFNIVVLPQD